MVTTHYINLAIYPSVPGVYKSIAYARIYYGIVTCGRLTVIGAVLRKRRVT